MPYIIRDASDGYAIGPAYRTYETEAKAKAAAQRAANRTGRDVAYGWAPHHQQGIKSICGACEPRTAKGSI